jgi:4-carboxymuconolactone decarboxylase
MRPPSSRTEAEAYKRGMQLRREVLGAEHVDRAVAATSELSEPFQDFITRTAWGDIWARPGLDRRSRSIATLAAVTALRAEGEIALHIRGAVRNGVTPEEISEVLLQTAIYAGLPAAGTAFRIAEEALAELES